MPFPFIRKTEIALLMRAFARAFEVEAPALSRLSADEALFVYREFTAVCMEAAIADAGLAERYRARLGKEAFKLGTYARRALAVRRVHAIRVARYFYRGIRIELDGALPGELRFGPCSFACRYSPRDCWFMSAFDEGFLRGISGNAEAALVFSCRLTEGAPCCKALFLSDNCKNRPARYLHFHTRVP